MYKLWIILILTVSLCGCKENVPKCYKNKTYLTNYWIPKENTKDVLNNGKEVYLVDNEDKNIRNIDNKVIKSVSKITYQKCQMEGTCLLDNILINLDSNRNTFKIVDRNKYPYGLGSNNNPLKPFVSVASNDIKIGTTLLIKELINIKLPNGMIHNGCVRVDDKGWSFDECQLDYFVVGYYFYVNMNITKYVTVSIQSCEILDYANDEVKNWFKTSTSVKSAFINNTYNFLMFVLFLFVSLM